MPLSISSSKLDQYQVYRISPSVWLRVFILSVPSVIVIGLLITPAISVGVKSLLIMLTGLSMLQAYRCHWPGAARAPAALSLDDRGVCEVELENGQHLTGAISDRLALPSLIILSLGNRMSRRAVVIPADALDAESHRQLRTQIGQGL